MNYDGRIILAAHRGDRKHFPENTMPAFEAALRMGADMIETDVHMTRDGELIIMHDRNPLRTTGHDGWTNEMTLEEIRQLDAGAPFSPDFAGTPVPTVRELLELVRGTDMLVNWELKDYPDEVGESFAMEAADKLIALLEEYQFAEQSMLNTFSDRVLEHIVEKHGHRFPIHGQGIGSCQRTRDRAAMPQEELYDWCCLYADVMGQSPLDYPQHFAHCIAHGIHPCVCLPDTMDISSRALELGCRMFTSNDIETADALLRALKRR